MARTPAWIRLLLLAVLAFGVAGMHTLGHQSLTVADAVIMPGHTGAHPGTAVAANLHTGAQAAAPETHADTTDAPGDPHQPVSPLSVCMAILCLAVLTILAVIAAHSTTSSLARLTPAVAATRRRADRAPPPAMRAGLHLATVSVMRL